MPIFIPVNVRANVFAQSLLISDDVTQLAAVLVFLSTEISLCFRKYCFYVNCFYFSCFLLCSYVDLVECVCMFHSYRSCLLQKNILLNLAEHVTILKISKLNKIVSNSSATGHAKAQISALHSLTA